MTLIEASRDQSTRLLHAILRSDLYSFLQAAFPIVSPGDTLRLNWHIEAMTYQLMRIMRGENTRLIINVPPRSLKSICASVAFPAFVLGHDPTRRIIGVSYSEILARKHANDCRALMRSDKYRGLFPSTRISSAKDTELEVMTTAGGYRLATSVGGTLTGRGGNLIVIDDPMKPQDAQSPSTRDAVWQWYRNTLLTRLDNKARDAIVVVMQRLHPDDLVGRLLEEDKEKRGQDKEWLHLTLPAIAVEEESIPLGGDRYNERKPDELLHPEWEPQKVLDDLKQGMGSLDFAAQYQQEPLIPGGNLIKWSWFRFYEQYPALLPNDRIIVSWDTAMSSNELSDYSVCVVAHARKDTVHILHVFRDRLEYPALKRKVIEMHERWRCENYALLIENKGSGLSLIQDLRQDNIHAIRIDPEGDKIIRMARQTARIEAGCVFLPASAAWLNDFRAELMAFPGGRHNDQIDALSQALDRAFNYRGFGAGLGRY
jgi:predicted phage terminase large subunit-like protein